jgi:hypothetical protein
MQNPEESLQTPETGPNEKPEITSVESTEAAAPIVEETIETPANEDVQEVVEASEPAEIIEEMSADDEVPAPIEAVVSEEPADEEKTPEVIQVIEVSESNVVSTEAETSEDDHEHDELQPLVAWHEKSRPELVVAMKELLGHNDLEARKATFSSIRAAYRTNKEEEVSAKRMKFIENGGDPVEFEVIHDDTDQAFDEAVKAFVEKRNDLRKQKEKELADNLKKKLEILDELKKMMENTENIPASFDRLHELQANWRNIGLVPAGHVDELWKNYHHHINNFYEVIKINKELRELDQKKNLELKTALCVKAEELLMEESIRKSLDDYKSLQDQWKDIGQVAREQSEVIWERFRSAGDKLFDRRRQYIQGQESTFNENLSLKTAVCERAEVILGEVPFKSHQHWQEASEKMAAALEDWKKIGFASRKDNEAIWQRFKTTRDAFYEAKEEFYKNLRNTQNQNYKLKVDLCMEAEALKESNDWKKTGERLRVLQEEWKKVGPVAKKHSDKLWTRFRKACDVFYENRNQHFAGMNSEQDENLKKKQELVAAISGFEQSEDNNANFEALKTFQAQWMEIGHVPMKEKDALHKAFRTAIDAQFAKLKAGNAESRRQVFRNQVSNISSNPHGKDKLHQQKNVVQDKIRRLQTEVQTLENNIGFFANSKSKAADDMRKDIERKISKAKEEIGALYDQLNILKEA